MVGPNPSDDERLRRIEKDLNEIRSRLEALERYVAGKATHPVDRTAVRDKVTYDWQK